MEWRFSNFTFLKAKVCSLVRGDTVSCRYGRLVVEPDDLKKVV